MKKLSQRQRRKPSTATNRKRLAEEFLHQATRADADYQVTGLPTSDWCAWRKGGETRLYLLNFKAEAVEVTVKGADGPARTVSLPAYGQQVLTAGR